jgi:transposase
VAHSSVSARRRVGAIDAPACVYAAAMLAGSLACDLGRGSTLAAYAGLAPTPWKSGSIDHEQVCVQGGQPSWCPPSYMPSARFAANYERVE